MASGSIYIYFFLIWGPLVNLPDLRPPASFVHAPTWLRLIEEQVTFVSADRVLGDIVDVQSISFELKGCIGLI